MAGHGRGGDAAFPPAWRYPCVLAMAAGCAAAPPPDANLHVTFDVTGKVMQSAVVLTHPGDAGHTCIQPQRLRLPSATGPAPRADQPPNRVFGYAVTFGPDFPREDAGLSPEWRAYGPQSRFSLDIFAAPGALEAEGPVRLGRGFRITVAAGGRLWERSVAEDGDRRDASVTIAADGLSGQFRIAGLVQQIPHNRMPDNEAIAIVGTWRCPRP